MKKLELNLMKIIEFEFDEKNKFKFYEKNRI